MGTRARPASRMPGNRAVSALAPARVPKTASPAVLRERACKKALTPGTSTAASLAVSVVRWFSGDLVLLGGDVPDAGWLPGRQGWARRSATSVAPVGRRPAVAVPSATMQGQRASAHAGPELMCAAG